MPPSAWLCALARLLLLARRCLALRLPPPLPAAGRRLAAQSLTDTTCEGGAP